MQKQSAHDRRLPAGLRRSGAGRSRTRALQLQILVTLMAGLLLVTPAQAQRPGAGGHGAGGQEADPVPAPQVLPADPPLDPEVVLRIDGVDVSRAAYLEFLFQQFDLTRVSEFVDEQLLKKRASALGVMILDEQVSQRVQEKIQHTIDTLFEGDAALFDRSLAQRMQNLAGFRRWTDARMKMDMLLEACILKERVIDDAAVMQQFEQIYGPGGVQHQIRHIMLRHASAEDASSPELLAEQVLGRLEKDPGLFPELVQQYSQDPLTRKSDGYLPNYQAGMFGAEFETAVRALEEEGQMAGPIRSTHGIHVVQLVKRTVTTFEEVREEVRRLLEARPPTTGERTSYRAGLRAGVRLEL